MQSHKEPCCTPIVSDAWEAEAGESLEPEVGGQLWQHSKTLSSEGEEGAGRGGREGICF